MPLLAVLLTALTLPGFTPYATAPGGGTVLTGRFPGTERAGYVYLPPGYSPSRRYPVVYLLHGMPGSPSEYLVGTNFTTFADDGIDAGTLKPFIAVIPAAGSDAKYNGEWAGPWEHALVDDVVPWVDAHLSTIASPSGRVIAGLSAGGFGAADIGIRNERVFGSIMSWSGYFHPLRDGPFKHATKAELAANDPETLVKSDADELTDARTRFFLSTGPYHSHWFKPAETLSFAAEIRKLKLSVKTFVYDQAKGEWTAQTDAGLTWAFGSS
jgi:enterochelin esterase-like enzyme